MKRCVLHIGMHKTGSSTIQRFLHNNRHRLGEGVLFADFGTPNHSIPMMYALMESPELHPVNRKWSHTKEQVNNLISSGRYSIRRALEADFHTLVFSAEAICHLNETELFIFRNQLLEYVDEIIVFAYVRPVVSYMASAFQQRLKAKVIGMDEKLVPRYKKIFSKFETVFLKIEYRLFDNRHLKNGDVISDFCEYFDLPFFQTKKENKSLRKLGVQFLYHLHKTKKTKKIKTCQVGLMTKSLADVGKDKFQLPKILIDNVLVKFSDDIAWMEQRLRVKGVLGAVDIKDVDVNTTTYDSVLNDITASDKLILQGLVEDRRLSEYVLEVTGMSIPEFVESSFVVANDD